MNIHERKREIYLKRIEKGKLFAPKKHLVPNRVIPIKVVEREGNKDTVIYTRANPENPDRYYETINRFMENFEPIELRKLKEKEEIKHLTKYPIEKQNLIHILKHYNLFLLENVYIDEETYKSLKKFEYINSCPYVRQ